MLLLVECEQQAGKWLKQNQGSMYLVVTWHLGGGLWWVVVHLLVDWLPGEAVWRWKEHSHKFYCYVAGNVFPTVQGHMTSNNETVSHQNLWAGNIAKSMMSEGNSALLPTNVDWRPTFQWGLMNF